MKVLRRCLLLAADYDLELESQWISTKDNALADALSRFDYNRVADLAPQLSYPACNISKKNQFALFAFQRTLHLLAAFCRTIFLKLCNQKTRFILRLI